MSTFKKIGTVFWVLVLVAIYANAGYWLGQIHQNAQGQVNPSILDSFFLGPNRALEATAGDLTPLVKSIIFTVLWPLILAFFSSVWLIYFMFCGGLFRTIGLVPSLLAVSVGIAIARIWYVNRSKKTKPIET